MIEVTQSTAVHVRVLMKGRDTNLGYPGYAASLTVSLAKSTESSFSDITSGVTITDLGLGWYDILLSTTHTNTLNIATLHVTGADVFDNDEVALNVIAINKADAVRAGLTALPNAVAAAANGLITFGSSTGQLNVASGKADAQVKGMDTDTLTSTALDATAVTEIQTGLASSTDVSTIEAAIAAVAADAATAVWAYVIENSLSALTLFRRYNGIWLAPASGLGGTVQTFRNLANGLDRAVATITGGVRSWVFTDS